MGYLQGPYRIAMTASPHSATQASSGRSVSSSSEGLPPPSRWCTRYRVSEDPVQRKRDGPEQPIGAELGHGFGRNRVKRVGKQGGGRDDPDHLVEQVWAVFRQAGAVAPGAVRERHELGPTLAQRQKQRQQQHQQEEPVAELHLDGHRAPERAKHEAPGDREHVEDDHVLDRHRVQREEREVGQRDDPEVAIDPEPHADRGGPNHGRGDRGGCGRQHTRRNRAARLGGMTAIGFAIADVVDQIDDARKRTEDDEGGHRGERPPWCQRGARKKSGRRRRRGSSSTGAAGASGAGQSERIDCPHCRPPDVRPPGWRRASSVRLHE